ncbi:MAG: hypothetical protein H8E25_12640 [Planctomycetes bacterium]|nr:hypothetical protein [Planctomycetota bacterium]
MKVRLSVWAVLALVLSLVFPWVRQLPYGAYLPDVWLLLLLLAVPTPHPHAVSKPLILAACLALLRSAVSLCSPIASFASLCAGMLLREKMSRRLSDSLFVYRFIVGMTSALPMALIDMAIAKNHGFIADPTIWIWRAALTGFLIAVFTRRSGGLMFGAKR